MRDPRRGTGRTTRMLKRASTVAKQGEHVVLVGRNQQHARQLKHLAVRMGAPPHNVTVATPQFIRGYTPANVFIDHYCWELA